jgi:hypothetical protein
MAPTVGGARNPAQISRHNGFSLRVRRPRACAISHSPGERKTGAPVSCCKRPARPIVIRVHVRDDDAPDRGRCDAQPGEGGLPAGVESRPVQPVSRIVQPSLVAQQIAVDVVERKGQRQPHAIDGGGHQPGRSVGVWHCDQKPIDLPIMSFMISVVPP